MCSTKLGLLWEMHPDSRNNHSTPARQGNCSHCAVKLVKAFLPSSGCVFQGLECFHGVVRTGLADVKAGGVGGHNGFLCWAGDRIFFYSQGQEKHGILQEGTWSERLTEQPKAVPELKGSKVSAPPPFFLLTPHLHPLLHAVTFCLFLRVQFFQSKSCICLGKPMLVTTQVQEITLSWGSGRQRTQRPLGLPPAQAAVSFW